MYNKLLDCQLREHFGELNHVPVHLNLVLQVISDAYDRYEKNGTLTIDLENNTELIITEKELRVQNEEKEKRAGELTIANLELAFQNKEKENRAAELIIANKELAFQNEEKEKRADELTIANRELAFQNKEKEKRAAELIVANKELAFQNEEKEKRADELTIANRELAFQNNEKEKRAAELIVANKELAFQNEEKEKRADELTIANGELAFQNNEKENRAAELIVANKELAFQNEEKEKRADELTIANHELAFQNNEKEKRAAELIVANKELAFQNEEKEKRADELTIANRELAFQNNEKENRAAELIIANKELAFQNEEKEKRADELTIANRELAFQNNEKENRAAELIVANNELAFQNEEKEKRAAEFVLSEGLLARAQQLAHLGSWELNFTDNMLTLSVEGCRIFGVEPDQNHLSSDTWMSLVHPGDIDKVMQTIKTSMNSLADTTYQHRIILKDGAIKHIKSESKFELDSEGKPIGMYGTMQDVTEKINAAQLLQFEKRDKEALINSTDDVMWSVSKDFKLIAANKAFIQSINAAVGITLQRDDYLLNPVIYPPEFLAQWKAFYEKALNGEIFKEEIHLPAFNSGAETWLETSFNPIYTEDKVVGIACYSRNITERKLAEKLIRETEAKYRIFFETSMDGIILSDASGEIFSANPAACAILLMTEDEICKAGRAGVMDLSDPRAAPFLKERYLTGKAKAEILLKRKDGTKFSSDISSSLYTDIYGKEKASVIIRDITERKKAEKIINESEQRYRSLFEEAADAICITDESLKFYDMNPNGCRMLGYSKEEFLNLSIADLFFIEDLIANPFKIDDLKSGKPIRSDRRFKRKDGTIIEVDLSGKLMKDGRFIMFGRDITERKKADATILRSEANLELKNKELELKNKELEQFAYVASHDMQEPLRTTSSFAELLRKQYKGKLDDKADKYLSFITESSERMKALIKDLLDYSRIGREKKLAEIDCNVVLKEVLADLGKAITETGAEIKAAILPVISGYPSEIKQLFQNLIMNSIKFRKHNTTPIITIGAQKKNNSWEFIIKDNGIGISEHHKERIFIIFQRLHTRTEYEGSGIGLAHCKKIVELHGGKIWIESKPGEGSTFHFTILKNKN